MEIQVKSGITVTLTKPAELNNANLLSLAYAIAAVAHEGQINKDGTPYITHPLRLVARWQQYQPENIIGQIVALLHDTIEDTCITFDILSALGFGWSIIDSLKELTRAEDPKEWTIDQREDAYRQHIQKLIDSNDPTAIINKIFDLEDNMDITRLTAPLDDWATRRTLKYHTAWLTLREAL